VNAFVNALVNALASALVNALGNAWRIAFCEYVGGYISECVGRYIW
jgi:hypothetical protein